MNCAAFEGALTEALAAPGPCDPATVASLRVHATGCDACRGSLDLVEIVAIPADERDPFPPPPPAYWTRFEGDLAARIAAERAKGKRRRVAWAAAAAIVVVALGAAVVLRRIPFGSETPRPISAVDEPVPSPDDAFDPFPAAGALGFADEDDPSLFPGPEDLPPDGEERLLEWLERERERASGGAA